MQQNTFMLLATVIFGTVATFFAIIGVASSGWPPNKVALFNWNNRNGFNYASAGVLLVIAIVILIIAILFTILFQREFIKEPSERIKGLLLACFVLAGIFMIAGYSRAVLIGFYSYHLSVIAGILTFFSAIFFTYWLGRTSVAIYN